MGFQDLIFRFIYQSFSPVQEDLSVKSQYQIEKNGLKFYYWSLKLKGLNELIPFYKKKNPQRLMRLRAYWNEDGFKTDKCISGGSLQK